MNVYRTCTLILTCVLDRSLYIADISRPYLFICTICAQPWLGPTYRVAPNTVSFNLLSSNHYPPSLVYRYCRPPIILCLLPLTYKQIDIAINGDQLEVTAKVVASAKVTAVLSVVVPVGVGVVLRLVGVSICPSCQIK